MKRVLSVAGSAVVGIALAGAMITPAHADPYDCSVGYPSRSKATGVCYGGTGEYRVYTRCDASLNLDYNRYGSWVRIGQISTASCSAYWGDRAYNAGVQVR